MSAGRTCVLDASALLALLHSEQDADLVEPLVGAAAISAVNWFEVQQRSLARGIEVADLRSDIEALGLEIVPFTAEDAERAGELWHETRQAGLSLGDRACLALASRLDVPALTADRAWMELEVGVEVRAIR